MSISRQFSDVRLASLEMRFHRFRAEALKCQLDHVKYHNTHEVYWGVAVFMRKYPYRTLGLGIGLGLVADFNTTGVMLDWLRQWLVQ